MGATRDESLAAAAPGVGTMARVAAARLTATGPLAIRLAGEARGSGDGGVGATGSLFVGHAGPDAAVSSLARRGARSSVDAKGATPCPGPPKTAHEARPGFETTPNAALVRGLGPCVSAGG